MSRVNAVWMCALLLVAACGRPLEKQQPVEVVVARFDPAAQLVPTPTDLVRDAEAKRLALPITDDLSPAERELRAWLNTFEGYPATVEAQVQLARQADLSQPAALDESSITPESLLVLDVTGFPAQPPRALAHTVVINEETGALTLRPEERWPASATVLIALRGGSKGLRAKSGAPLDADVTFYFLRGAEKLDEHASVFPGETPGEQLKVARQLEAVRQSLQPHFEAVESLGVPREELAVLWTFTLQRDRDQVDYDPLAKKVPFPNDIVRTNGKVELPIEETDSEDAKSIKRGLTGVDGFSTSAAITFTTSLPVEPTTLTAASVKLFKLTEDGPIEVAKLARRVHANGQTVILEPIDASAEKDSRAPLDPASRYLAVVTDALRAEGGRPLEASVFTSLLKFRAPLTDESGKSTLSVLSDESAQITERLRADVAPALDRLEAQGLTRDRMTLVFSFTTFDTVATLRALNDAPYAAELPVALNGVTMEVPALKPGIVKPMPNTGFIVNGTIATWDRLDMKTREFRADGSGEAQEIGFAACLPLTAQTGVKLPVMVFGHGLGTAKELVYLLCDPFAEVGYAMIAVDFPLHGQRSICAEDAHCNEGHSCSLDEGVCRDAQGAQQPLRHEPIIWSQGIEQPVSLGHGFVDMESLFATRDHFQQAQIDLAALVRVIRNADWPAALGGYDLDGEDISYLGISLGGIIGSHFSAAEPRIGAYVLNVPGAGFVQMVQDSESFKDDFATAMSERGIELGSDLFFQFENAARWILDPADPMNSVRHARKTPYAYSDPEDGVEKLTPEKKILVQMATPDLVVPNTSTILLSRMFGVTPSRYYPVDKPGLGGHVFLFDPSEPEGERAIDEAILFLDEARSAP